MPPPGGSHCSRNSRWFTVPRQQPCSQSSAASVSVGAGVAAVGGVVAGVAGAAMAAGGLASGADEGGVAGGACANVTPAASSKSTASAVVVLDRRWGLGYIEA